MGVAPWRILAVTFTTRLAECASGSWRWSARRWPEVGDGHLHAVCARMLRRDGMAIGLDPRFVIYDTATS